MNITDAREWVRDAVRDMADTSRFTANTIDRAIQQAGMQFCRETRSVIRTDSVTITEDSTSFPIVTPLTFGFLPERLIDVWITNEETAYHEELTVVSYQELAQLAKQDDGSSVPTHLAFRSGSAAGTLWRVPDDGYTADLRYWQPFGVTVSAAFSLWTPGTADAPTLAGTLNIPDHNIMPVLKYGAAAAALEANKETRPLAEMLMGQFKAHIAETMGSGNLGPRVLYRESMHARPRPMRLGESEA